jgi:hypothetical protein
MGRRWRWRRGGKSPDWAKAVAAKAVEVAAAVAVDVLGGFQQGGWVGGSGEKWRVDGHNKTTELFSQSATVQTWEMGQILFKKEVKEHPPVVMECDFESRIKLRL